MAGGQWECQELLRQESSGGQVGHTKRHGGRVSLGVRERGRGFSVRGLFRIPRTEWELPRRGQHSVQQRGTQEVVAGEGIRGRAEEHHTRASFRGCREAKVTSCELLSVVVVHGPRPWPISL